MPQLPEPVTLYYVLDTTHGRGNVLGKILHIDTDFDRAVQVMVSLPENIDGFYNYGIYDVEAKAIKRHFIDPLLANLHRKR